MSLSSERRRDYNLISKDVHDPELSYDDFSRGYILKDLCELKRYYKGLDVDIESIKGKDDKNNNINLLQVVGKILKTSPRTIVKITFLNTYPRHPPCVVVDPGEDGIIIKTSVFDRYGVISASFPYIRDWNFYSSTVLSLVLNFDHGNLVKTIDLKTMVLDLTFDGVFSKHQAKLARLLVTNGRRDLYNKIACLPKDEQKKAFFDAVIARYLPNKDLAKHIETKKDGINGFIKIAEDAAKPFLERLSASKGAASSSHELVPPLDYSLDPEHLYKQFFQRLPFDDKDYDVLNFSGLFTHSLPYEHKDCIERHLSQLARDYPYLNPKTRNVDYEGSEVNFVVVEGPILFHSDVVYNEAEGIQIPSDVQDKRVVVTIWLRKSYPVDRPRVYVKCPSGKQIDGHGVNVLPNGAVHFSYLQEWVGDRSSLIGLVSHLRAEFSCQSPNFVNAGIHRPSSSRDDQGGSRAISRRRLNQTGSATCDGKSEYQVPDAGQSIGQGYLEGQDISSEFSDALNLDSHTLNQKPEEADGQVSPCEESGTGSIVPKT